MSDPVVRPHIGWHGQFTTAQAEGALPNGTRIRKVRSEPNDANRDGATGRVLGSLAARGLLGYFIEWDAMPRLAVFVASHRIAVDRKTPAGSDRLRAEHWM